METINRLLKKQTRTRNNKRSAVVTPEDHTPGLGDEDAENDVTPETPPPAPMTYRWVSSAREDGGERIMQLRFSVPYAAFPATLRPPEPEEGSEDRMDVDPDTKPVVPKFPPVQVLPPPRPRCAVDGCGEVMKYRLPSQWQIGACGMTHLNVLRTAETTTKVS
jgi:Ino eighty subunit 2